MLSGPTVLSNYLTLDAPTNQQDNSGKHTVSFLHFDSVTQVWCTGSPGTAGRVSTTNDGISAMGSFGTWLPPAPYLMSPKRELQYK